MGLCNEFNDPTRVPGEKETPIKRGPNWRPGEKERVFKQWLGVEISVYMEEISRTIRWVKLYLVVLFFVLIWIGLKIH